MEKRMACGVGACLSCVVDTVAGRKRRPASTGQCFDGRGGGLVAMTDASTPESSAPSCPTSPSNLGGLLMKNPVTVASGTFGAGRSTPTSSTSARLGAVTTKGVSLERLGGQRQPRASPRLPVGMLNSIGLQNPGVGAL